MKRQCWLRAALVSMMLLALVASTACTQSKPEAKPEAKPAPAPKSHLVIGLASDLTQRGVDPAMSSGVPQQVVAMNIFDNLLYLDTDGILKPGLITSWEVSKDGLIYTFKLKKGVVFHDGTPFNAEAVRFHFDRIMDPATASPARAYMGPYDKSEVVDDSTLKVYFKKPYAPFLTNLGRYFFGIPSPTAAKKLGKDIGFKPVGSGPFKFKEWVPGQSIVLVRNDDYKWAPDIYKNKGKSNIEQITFRFIPEDVPRMGALETGECNVVVYLSADGLARFKADPAKYATVTVPVTGIGALNYLNTQKFPTNDLAVRQAINYAADQKTMIDTLFKGTRIPATGLLAPNILGYHKDIENYYPYDPAKAKQVLDQAGWKVGSDGIRVKNGQRLKIDMVILDGAAYKMTGEWQQAELKKVGIEVNLVPMASPARVEAGQKGTHNSSYVGNEAVDPDILYLFHSSEIGNNNWSRLSDKEIDGWLEKARAEASPDVRKDLYYKVQKRVMEQALVLPVWYTTHLYAFRTGVKGLRHDGCGYYLLLHDVTLETK